MFGHGIGHRHDVGRRHAILRVVRGAEDIASARSKDLDSLTRLLPHLFGGSKTMWMPVSLVPPRSNGTRSASSKVIAFLTRSREVIVWIMLLAHSARTLGNTARRASLAPTSEFVEG